MTVELPRHNLTHLYKYTSSEVAEKIITTQKFRWSSPLLFNDPFDHQTGVKFPFNGDELADALNLAFETAVFGATDFRPVVATKYGSMLSKLRTIRERLARDDVMDEMRVAGAEIAKGFQANCDQLNSVLTADLTHSRVLCLTETPENFVMWSHYADEHKGAVFKLRRLQHLDHRFLIAQRVTYSDEPVTYLPLDEYVAHLIGAVEMEVDPSERILQIAYRKHSNWGYEREWRIHMPLLNEPPGSGFTDMDEPKELFEAVYLGVAVDDQKRSQIVQLARQYLPLMEIYQAHKAADRMRLEFDRIA